MTSICDQVRIHDTPSAVYQALTRQEGYRGWWNKVAEVSPSVGGEAHLRFVKDGHPVGMRFRIDELRPDERVHWTCVDHDMAIWVDTWLIWRIEEVDGAVVVTLEHGGWKESAPEMVADGWRHFLGSLKSYVETGTGQPW